LNKNQPFKEYACLWAETQPNNVGGGQKAKRKIEFEVCGSEEVEIQPVSESLQQYPLKYFASDELILGLPYKHTYISNLRSYFKTKNTNPACLVSKWHLLDNNSNILVDSAFLKIQNSETRIAIKTDVEGYTTTIKLKNSLNEYYEIQTPGRQTWTEAYNFARAQGGRLATFNEAKALVDANGGAAFVTGDMWVPVGDPSNKDWIQIGDHASHFPGKSHVAVYGYPSWGNNN
jgi:hypothetical protein